jgi:hypothetical protein
MDSQRRNNMDTHPTYDDVTLILKLYNLRREEKVRKAREWFASFFKAQSLDEFNRLCPPESDENAYFRMVTSYWEMVASFITGGVLSEKLFFQSGRELLFVWERVRSLIPSVRESRKDNTYLKNLETVGGAYAKWLDAQSPGAYAAFSSRVLGS